jgi:hypothetical protein
MNSNVAITTIANAKVIVYLRKVKERRDMSLTMSSLIRHANCHQEWHLLASWGISQRTHVVVVVVVIIYNTIKTLNEISMLSLE